MSDVDPSTISQWENGRRDPSAWYAYVLCDFLGVGPEALALEDILTPSVLEEFGESVRELSALNQAREGTMMLGESAYETIRQRVGPAMGASPPDWERLAYILLATGRMDGPAVSDLQRMTSWFIESRATIAPRLILPPLHQHLLTLRTVLPLTPEQYLGDVISCAGRTAVAIGGVWHTIQDYGEAQTAFRFALELGRETGDVSIQAMALIGRCLLYASPVQDNDEGLNVGPHRPLDLLVSAEALAGLNARTALRMWLYSVRSYHYAAVGDAVAAGRDLDAAERARAQMTEPPTDLFAPYDETYLRICRGKVHMLLKDMATALRWYELAAEPGSQGHQAAFFNMQLATACARAGDIDRAGELLLSIAELALDARITLLLRRIARVASRELAEYPDHPTVRELRERLEDHPD